MEIAEAYRRSVENIKVGMECPKAFKCCQPGLERPCPVRAIANGKLLECLEDRQKPCKFAVEFGLGRFCECPLRAFLLKNFASEKS